MSCLPSTIKNDPVRYSELVKVMNTIESKGYLNTLKLLDKKKISLNKTPISRQWIINEEADAIFIG